LFLVRQRLGISGGVEVFFQAAGAGGEAGAFGCGGGYGAEFIFLVDEFACGEVVELSIVGENDGEFGRDSGAGMGHSGAEWKTTEGGGAGDFEAAEDEGGGCGGDHPTEEGSAIGAGGEIFVETAV
jgi:hypothetical protein